MKTPAIFRVGLRGKLAWMFLLTSLLPLLGVGYYGYSTTSESLSENMRISNQESLANIAGNVQAFLGQVPEDLRFLEGFYALQSFLQWRGIGEPYKTRDWGRDTRKAFASFLAARNIYSQLQVIANEGGELLRLDYDSESDTVSVAAESDLQDQRKQAYFQGALALEQGRVHATPLHLGQDLRGLSQPMLRYATPILDQDGARLGVLVLTLRGDSLIRLVQNNPGAEKQGGRLLLVDSQGQYLFHPERHLEWGRARNHGVLLDGEFPELSRAIAAAPRQGVLIGKGFLSVYQQLFPLAGGSDYWVLIKQIDSRRALQKVTDFRNLFILGVAVVIVLVLLFSHWFANRLSKPLLAVRDKLQSLSRGKPSAGEISYASQDEISEILQAERLLRESFQGVISQTQAVAAGNYHSEVKLLSEEDELGQALAHMTRRLREMSSQTSAQDWLKSGQAKLAGLLSGEQEVLELAKKIIRFLAIYVQAPVGVIYLVDESNPRDPVLKMAASHAFNQRRRLSNQFRLGEGIVGQAALEQEIIHLNRVPEDYLVIESGLGESAPHHVLVAPFMFEDKLKGAIELATFLPLQGNEKAFIETVLPAIGVALNTAESRLRMRELLAQTQAQSEELQAQAEELQSQTEELQAQQEELRQINEELEERTRLLERQQKEVETKNTELERAKGVVQAKAEELERASRYKSEFLANMSHELRTPLNSLLILGQILSENKTGNLTEKQVEYARTILSAGSDLLSLINDILDLAKVESGKMQVACEDYPLSELVNGLEAKFRHVAEDKGLRFGIEVEENLPPTLYTDPQRLRQIVNNLLSNAFKFTTQGGITLAIRRPAASPLLQQLGLAPARSLVIQVKDSGIGIPQDKLNLIFEAFQQADGTTSRRFGGTGLGLSISRQLSRLLGGDIQAESAEGQGSIFSLYLPEQMPKQAERKEPIPTAPMPAAPIGLAQAAEVSAAEIAETTQMKELGEIYDDRQNLHAQDKSILIIEDDRNFSRILLEISREKGFKCLLAEDGRTGLQLAREYRPNAVVLDVGLPQMDGWSVMEQLKEDPETRHIPVHFISASDHDQEARRMGAIGYLLKPVSMAEISEAFKRIENFIARGLRNLLLLSDQPKRQQEISALVADDKVSVTIAESQAQAWDRLQAGNFDCLVLDLDLENRSGLVFLEQLSGQDKLSKIPVILYADRDLDAGEEKALRQLEDALTLKAVRSPERLLDETTLFLHQVEATLPKEKRNMLRMVHDKEALLAGKRVLVVDDDMRNTFALATVLEDREMEVVVAKDGKEALSLLANEAPPDLVLMDIMMPEMDGYEAIRLIRNQDRFRKLPIIALTAKAMKGDKSKCIEAGANDYLPKPVDTDKLMSLMRVWLYR
jgi:signal transduction histidine kinase/DNA-binding response OmpR family regulator